MNAPTDTSPAASPGCLTTHVLDTMHGIPAEGMKLELYVRESSPDGCSDGRWLSLRSVVTNADGRLDRPSRHPVDPVIAAFSPPAEIT